MHEEDITRSYYIRITSVKHWPVHPESNDFLNPTKTHYVSFINSFIEEHMDYHVSILKNID